MSCNPKTGNLFKCSDCKYFTSKVIAQDITKTIAYSAPDGVCSKVFGRGYVRSKGEHKVYSGQMHCFEFEWMEDSQ